MKDFLQNRLKEGSTIRGILWCLAAFGIWSVTADQRDAIVALMMALGGAGGIVTPDRLFPKKLGPHGEPRDRATD